MSEEFVRKDVHNAELRRIDEKIDATVFRIEAKTDAHMARVNASFEEMKAQNAAFREHVSNELSDMRGEIQDMRGDMKQMRGEISAIKADLNNISRNVALIMTIFGLAISAVTILIQFIR